MGDPECPGPDCLMCNGAACNKCGAGCWGRPEKPCDHATDERHHDPGTDWAGRTPGPATSADLLELDAVPEPVDSDAPAAVHARTLARARP